MLETRERREQYIVNLPNGKHCNIENEYGCPLLDVPNMFCNAFGAVLEFDQKTAGEFRLLRCEECVYK